MAADASVETPPAALAEEPAAPPAALPAVVMADLMTERLATRASTLPWMNVFSMRTKSFSETTSSGYSISIGFGAFLSASTAAPFALGFAFVSFFVSLAATFPMAY